MKLILGCGFGDFVDCIHDEGVVAAIVPPHIIFQQIVRRNRVRFKRHFGADENIIEQFWQGLFLSQDGRELRRLHPQLRNRDPYELRHHIPLILHEDAGPFSKRKSVDLVPSFVQSCLFLI